MSIVKKSLDRSKLKHEYKPSAFWPSLRKEDAEALALQYDAQQGKARNKLKKKGETEADAVCRLFRTRFLEFPSAKHLFSQAQSVGAADAQALALSYKRVHVLWEELTDEERATWESKAKEERVRASKKREATWTTVILDEAHFLKNPGAVSFLAVLSALCGGCLDCFLQCDERPRRKARALQ